jgi:tetratricopeptide (TPR) repeat protein
MSDARGDKHSVRNEISGGFFFSAVIQGRDISVQLPPEITPALSGLPTGSAAFTGRDTDLCTLLDFLVPSVAGADSASKPPGASPPSTVVVAAVGGLAGIGKTELAIQAVRTALGRGWFPGGVLFVDLFGYDPARSLDPGQALEGFLRALAIPAEHIPPHTQDRARLYASVLAAYAREGRRILVVIDNAATEMQVKPLLPTEPGNKAIVTSRDTLGMLGAHLLDLDVLSCENAVHMLDRALRVARPSDSRVTDHPADAVRVAQLCGGLPLALQISAALLSEDPRRSPAEMAADLDDERTRLEELSYADTEVRAAFDLSYQRLDPDRAHLFRLLTINTGPDISTQATAALVDADERAVRHDLEALARAHLIDHGSSHGRWRMHDLVRLYARQLADIQGDAGGRELARNRLLLYYLHTAEAADDHLRALPDAPVPPDFTGLDSALAWFDAERSNLVAAVTMAADHGRDQIAMRLPACLTQYFGWRQRFDEQLATTTICLAAARRLGNPGDEAKALLLHGSALRNVGQFEEAITTQRRAVALFRLTGRRIDEGLALINLGNALRDAGRFEDAITAYQDAAPIARQSGDHHFEASVLGPLGRALRNMGRLEEAITAQQEAAAFFRESRDSTGEGMALNELGISLRESGRFDEAIDAHQRAAALFQEPRTPHFHGEALNNLGLALREAGRFLEAIIAHRDAADIFREINDLHNEGDALNNLELARAVTGLA